MNANGTFSYVHDGSEIATDTFTYAANDGYINGNTVTVTISITPVNDPPVTVVGSDTLILDEAGTVTITSGGGTSLLDNDTDAEGDTLVAIGVSSPTNGTITINPDGTFTYVHDGSDTTTDTFSYKVNDGTADGNTVTITITINPVNDPPIAVSDELFVGEGGTVTTTLNSIPGYLPTNGLMAWYPFNGNSDDESGNGNNGTVYGAVLDDDLNSLNNSNSYRFDGGDDYISIGNDSSLNPSSALSFSAWISLNNLNDRLNIILGEII